MCKLRRICSPRIPCSLRNRATLFLLSVWLKHLRAAAAAPRAFGAGAPPWAPVRAPAAREAPASISKRSIKSFCC